MRQVGFLRPKLESRWENAILVVAASAPVARVAGAQCCGQGPHDQALVRRAVRYGGTSRFGLHVFAKPDDDTGTRSGESLMVSAKSDTAV